MNDKFFPELARRLKQESIATAPIQYSVDDLEQRVNLSNQRELEEGNRQTGSPGWEMKS